MNKPGFIVAVVAILLIVLIGGVAYMYSYPAPASETCVDTTQEILAIGFKGDAVVFGLLGAVAAAILYHFMLRYQIFFPGSDAKRFISAAVAFMAVAFVLTVIDSLSGPACLRRAIGAGSAVAEQLAPTKSLTGPFVQNMWVAIVLDQLLLALAGVGVVRVYKGWSLGRA
ncbi:MAG: hypothetical protein HY665_05895 [Chloroflexi bacterium]|nr:hypothetical protein [Chloroflexota bacterium]